MINPLPSPFNSQRFLATVIKFQVGNLAILNSSSSPNLVLFVFMDLSLFNRPYQFQRTKLAIVNKDRPLFVGFLRHKYIFWLFKDTQIIRDRANLKNGLVRHTRVPDWSRKRCLTPEPHRLVKRSTIFKIFRSRIHAVRP